MKHDLRLFSGAATLAAALLVAAPGCSHFKGHTRQTEEEAPRLASMVHMGDPRAAGQLTNGFHEIEANAWRWTARQFAVTLRPPSQAAKKGAVLEVRLTVPPVIVGKLQTISLSASIAGNALAAETYSKPGDYIYRRNIAANLLAGDSVRIDFQLDKALPPGSSDLRELGIVVASAGLVSK